jgi:predicted GNAT superfamily acetyltransferase
MKRVLQPLLLLIVLAGLGLWAWGRFGSTAPATPGVPATAQADGTLATADAPAHVVQVTYFTTDVRCLTCEQIETLTQRTVAERFAAEVAGGALVFQTRNLDEPENARFAEDYQLSFKTVVVSDRRGGEEQAWAKFDDVWSHANDPEAFMLYLESGIRAYLDAPAL